MNGLQKLAEKGQVLVYRGKPVSDILVDDNLLAYQGAYNTGRFNDNTEKASIHDRIFSYVQYLNAVGKVNYVGLCGPALTMHASKLLNACYKYSRVPGQIVFVERSREVISENNLIQQAMDTGTTLVQGNVEDVMSIKILDKCRFNFFDLDYCCGIQTIRATLLPTLESMSLPERMILHISGSMRGDGCSTWDAYSLEHDINTLLLRDRNMLRGHREGWTTKEPCVHNPRYSGTPMNLMLCQYHRNYLL